MCKTHFLPGSQCKCASDITGSKGVSVSQLLLSFAQLFRAINFKYSFETVASWSAKIWPLLLFLLQTNTFLITNV